MAQLQSSGVTGSIDVITTNNTRDYTVAHNNLGNISGIATINITDGSYISARAIGNIDWSFVVSADSSVAIGFALELSDGGYYTQTWPSSVYWQDGSVPELTPGGKDILTFITRDGGSSWVGAVSL